MQKNANENKIIVDNNSNVTPYLGSQDTITFQRRC